MSSADVNGPPAGPWAARWMRRAGALPWGVVVLLLLVPVAIGGWLLSRAGYWVQEEPEPPPTPAERARFAELPKSVTLDCGSGVTMDLVLIPAGSFMMGSPLDEAKREPSEGPQRQVTILRPFYMGRYEVTQAQWKAVMGTNPSFPAIGDRFPVGVVTWQDCQAFCQKLSTLTGRTIRLPSEAEWEYACRAGTTTAFHFGHSLDRTQANYDVNLRSGLARADEPPGECVVVGSFAPNAFGLYDMHGNVQEWCQDVWHKDYTGAPATGKAWERRGDSEERVVRGGSWLSRATECRAASRLHVQPGFRFFENGLRVVMEAPRARD